MPGPFMPSSQFRNEKYGDPFTDYSGQKYLLAWKLGGIVDSNSWLPRLLEVHTGFYNHEQKR